MTSRTNIASRGSTAYSRMTWKPRRATFSVKIDRFKTSTLTRCETVAATSNATRLLLSWVSSNVKTMAVKGDRVTPPSAPAMPCSAHHEDGRQDAATRPSPEPDGPDDELHHEDRDERTQREAPEQFRVDRAVADAERPRVEEATDADHGSCDRRPPHPVQPPGELRKEVLGSVDALGHEPRREPRGDPYPTGAKERHRAQRGVERDRKQWLRSDEAGTGHRHADAVRGRGSQPDQDHGTRLELERQQLDAEERRGDRGAEDAAHPGGGSGNEQCTALRGGQPEELTNDGTHGATSEDDRSLGTEWAAGPNADRTGNRFQHSEARLDPTSVHEDPLHRFGNPVAPDLLGAEPRHQADHQSAPDRHDDGN